MSPSVAESPASGADTPDDELEQMHNETGRRSNSGKVRKVRLTKGGVRNNKRERLTDKVTVDRYLLYDDRPDVGTGFFRVVGICSRCISYVPNSARFMVSSVLAYINHCRRQVYVDGIYLKV